MIPWRNWIFGGTQGLPRQEGQATSCRQLLHTVLATSREWLWALDSEGRFRFSSDACKNLLGYRPAELIGEHFSIVIDVDHLPDSIAHLINSPEMPGSAEGLVRCRHRDGRTVWIDSSVLNRPARRGRMPGLEGTSQRYRSATLDPASIAIRHKRLSETIDETRLRAAFQPIRDLSGGHLVGAEALARFQGAAGANPERWFAEAAALGRSADLELAALGVALEAAQHLPTSLYVALNVSPATCLDPRLSTVLESSDLPLERLVLELTERLEVERYSPLTAALEPLRCRGLRVAIDDTGAGFSSMRHVLRLRPDIIKLDRSLIAGIDDDDGQRALGAAMTVFASQIGATIVAEGVETESELAAVKHLGMAAAQGYLLGRPTTEETEWARWRAETWPATGRFN